MDDDAYSSTTQANTADAPAICRGLVDFLSPIGIQVRAAATFNGGSDPNPGFFGGRHRFADATRITLAFRRPDNRRFSNWLGHDPIGPGTPVLLRALSVRVDISLTRT